MQCFLHESKKYCNFAAKILWNSEDTNPTLYKLTSIINTTKSMYKFKASHISATDNVIFPDKLEIDTLKVVFYKGRIFGYETTVIQRSNIGSVSVDAGVLFADITIETNGGQVTKLHGFSKSNARKIAQILSC